VPFVHDTVQEGHVGGHRRLPDFDWVEVHAEQIEAGRDTRIRQGIEHVAC
jgi:hypothetical protein